MEERIQNVIEALSDLREDLNVPKNVKLKINETIITLQQDKEISIKVNKALQELEGISEDSNMQSYTRTQLFNIVSLLEVIA